MYFIIKFKQLKLYLKLYKTSILIIIKIKNQILYNEIYDFFKNIQKYSLIFHQFYAIINLVLLLIEYYTLYSRPNKAVLNKII